VYKDENLIERAAQMGEVLERELAGLQAKHPSLGEYRGVGLFYAIELVKNRETREPMSGFNQPPSEGMKRLAGYLRENGLFTMVRWNWIFCAPPLVITEEQLREAIEIISGALDITDSYCEG
jgi:taurine--2-oxoglutarate transaminase